MILQCLLPKFMHLKGPKLSSALEEYPIISQYFGSKINVLKEINVLSAVFLSN